MQEIVAAKIGTVITNVPAHIVAALEMNQDVEFLCRQHMQFMAAFDLGQRWNNLARSRTLFVLDDDGNLQEAE